MMEGQQGGGGGDRRQKLTLRINFAEGLLGERVAGHAGYVHMLEGNNDRLVGSDDSMARLWVHATSPTSPHAKELIAHAALAAAVLEDARTYHEELDASWEDLAAAVAQVDDGDAHRSFAAVEAIAGEGPVVATAAIGCRSRHDPSVCRLGRVEERADGVAPVGGEAKDPGRANGGASVDELDRLQLQGIFVVHEVTRAGVSPSDDVSFRHVHLILRACNQRELVGVASLPPDLQLKLTRSVRHYLPGLHPCRIGDDARGVNKEHRRVGSYPRVRCSSQESRIAGHVLPVPGRTSGTRVEVD
eukprot:762820-Hanusia_phi.AAC.2